MEPPVPEILATPPRREAEIAVPESALPERVVKEEAEPRHGIPPALLARRVHFVRAGDVSDP